MTAAVASEVLRLWERHEALSPAAAEARLPEVVAVRFDAAGTVVGAASAFAAELGQLGGCRVWVQRLLDPDGDAASRQALTRATFAALAAAFEAPAGGPLGLVVLTDPADLAGRPDLEEADPRLLHAGFLPDGRQLRVAWFDGARVAGGTVPNPPIPVDRVVSDRRIERFAEQSAIGAADIVALWTAHGVLTPEEAERRVREVLLVATHDGSAAGVCTVYLQHDPLLRLDLWHIRAFVAPEHRLSDLAMQMVVDARRHLTARSADGSDRRASGMLMEVEHPALKARFDEALWWPTDFSFVGLNPRGDHRRVHYFPGGRVPGA